MDTPTETRQFGEGWRGTAVANWSRAPRRARQELHVDEPEEAQIEHTT
jgi:hypothetical protein